MLRGQLTYHPSLITFLTLIVGLLAVCPLAHATFPGKNGRIAFSMAGDVYTMNPDGTDVTQLTSFAVGGYTVYLPSWSPDGRQIAFGLLLPDSSTEQLWIMNNDGTNQRLLLNDPSFSDSQPSFSPDGMLIAFTRCQINCAIYTVGRDGSGLHAITPFDPNPDVFDFMAEYSPDGKTIAFSNAGRGGVIAGVYLVDVDGSNIRQLTPPVIGGWSANWSPDGSSISFASQLVQGVLDEDLYTIKPDGTGEQQITNNNRHWNGYLTGDHDSRPSWSPQGDAIAFERDAPDFSSSAIFILKPDGSTRMLASAAPGQKSRVRQLPTLRSLKTTSHPNNRLNVIEVGGLTPNWGPAPK